MKKNSIVVSDTLAESVIYWLECSRIQHQWFSNSVPSGVVKTAHLKCARDIERVIEQLEARRAKRISK